MKTLVDPEGLMLSEISLTKTNTTWFHMRNLKENPNKYENKHMNDKNHKYRGHTGGCQRGRVSGNSETRDVD